MLLDRLLRYPFFNVKYHSTRGYLCTYIFFLFFLFVAFILTIDLAIILVLNAGLDLWRMIMRTDLYISVVI
jgi:hypothetical protein